MQKRERLNWWRNVAQRKAILGVWWESEKLGVILFVPKKFANDLKM